MFLGFPLPFDILHVLEDVDLPTEDYALLESEVPSIELASVSFLRRLCVF